MVRNVVFKFFKIYRMFMDKISQSQRMELADLTELVRLVTANSQNRGGHIYTTKLENGKWMYFLTHIVPSWYDLEGLPITVYVETEIEPTGSFINYLYSGDNSKESWEFVTIVGQNSQSAYIPVVKLKSLPNFI